jgi:hypothetical protein
MNVKSFWLRNRLTLSTTDERSQNDLTFISRAQNQSIAKPKRFNIHQLAQSQTIAKPKRFKSVWGQVN